MEAKYINAVCRAAEEIFNNHFELQTELKSPFAGKYAVESNKISVIIGVNGQLDGQIITSFDVQTAKNIVGLMMGSEEEVDMDDMAWSAIQEFGNWIAGRTATELSQVGAVCDVTTPIVNEGDSKFRSANIFFTVPLETKIGDFQINVSLKEAMK